MSSTFSLASALLSFFALRSSALPPPSNPIASSPNKPAALVTRATNGTSLQDITSPVLSYNAECSYTYGRDPSPNSCANALAKIPRAMLPMAFGQRDTGPWDVILPRRYLSDDGFCGIDVKVGSETIQHDVSNFLQISDAANAVLRTCVNRRPNSRGGSVKGLGAMYRSLSVEMFRFSQPVLCHDDIPSTPPYYFSCLQVLDEMRWSEGLVRFGLPWQHGAQVLLPYFLISRDNQCKLMVGRKFVPGSTVEEATWSNLWSAAVAVNEMCVKNGKSGNTDPISVGGTLVLFLFGRGSYPPPEVLSSLNISATDLNMLPTLNTTLVDHNSSALVTVA